MSNYPIKFALITDPHYFSAKLGCTGDAYERRAASDQKMLAPSRGAVIAALEKIKTSGAQFLLIPGDLSNDGERCSHEEMRELLYEFKQTMPVCVTTATHDWCCDGNPRRYEGDQVLHDVDTVPVGELRDFYKDFGPEDALSEFFTHQHNSSYAARPCEGLTVLCLNDDQNGDPCTGSGYSEEHWAWIAEQVAAAKARGDKVVAMQHHHMFTSEFMRVINGNGSVQYKEEMAKRFADLGMSVMFTGHSHMTSIRKIVSDAGNPFYEINVGSISGYPAPILYGTVTEDGIQINTEYLDSFTYDGKTYTNDDLREHATLLFKNVIDAAHTGDKRRFEALMESLSMSHEKADKLWKKAKPALRWLEKLRVRKAARIINFIACGQQIDRKAAKEIGDLHVTQIIYDTFAAILDGSREKHPEGTAYYKVFVGACAFPLKMVKRFHIKNGGLLRTLTHLKDAAPELMTGGPLNNTDYFIEWENLLVNSQ